MEDTLGDNFGKEIKDGAGLNPCSNGRYSRRINNPMSAQLVLSLNPCSNGRYSRRR